MPFRRLPNTPIKRKLTFITMLTSGVAITIACMAFLTYDLVHQHEAMINDLATTATILGDNSTAALSFNDPDSAKQTLNSLTTHPHIVAAAVYGADGKVFAQYQSPAFHGPFIPPPMQANGHETTRQATTLFHSIRLDGERVGAIYLQTDMQEARARLSRYTLIFVVVMAAASGAAFLISNKLQAVISRPILHLSEVAKQVAADKNYSIRAVKTGHDELGHLIDGFNAMLDQIQRHEAALQEARGDLERRVAERTQELAHSLSVLNATLESSADGIMAHSFADGSVYNAKFAEMWRIPFDTLQNMPRDEILRLNAEQTKDPERYKARIQELRKTPTLDDFELIELKDGRAFERFVKPMWLNGQVAGAVINFRDITTRRRAAEELETAHKQLLETSRQAGMAEVATGVLHNVGNVLNSVNVSTNLLTENAKNSKIGSLAKAVSLLTQHQDHLGAFISDDPRGRYLPKFLLQLSEHLFAEHEAMLKELDSLRGNIDHIKQIVAMQQTYSKVSGVKERVNVVDLVEDALRMNEGALRRHGVQVVREFTKVPVINTEKHKILQILVNLMRNAKYACSESGRTDKRMSLRVANGDGRIKIVVGDNGVGIAPENLTRIFSHGFTTRRDGHGFGLHSGALAARELGGALRAHSDGLGQGAQFTLELPCEIAEAVDA